MSVLKATGHFVTTPLRVLGKLLLTVWRKIFPVKDVDYVQLMRAIRHLEKALEIPPRRIPLEERRTYDIDNRFAPVLEGIRENALAVAKRALLKRVRASIPIVPRFVQAEVIIHDLGAEAATDIIPSVGIFVSSLAYKSDQPGDRDRMETVLRQLRARKWI